MAASNRERVGRVLDLLNQGLQPFVVRELKSFYGDKWKGATAGFIEESKDGELHWDSYGLLRLMWDQWNDVFKKTLGRTERSLVSELRDTRNRWAHQEPFTLDDAYRAMDSVERLLSAVSAPEAEEAQREKYELQRARFEDQARRQRRKATTASLRGAPEGGLLPWREIVTPHPDVASGRYQQAEFAADLAQVYRGEGTSEYKDPKEFYQRTFITEGLRRLLVGAIKRVAGKDGDPIIQLQTNFGGGKTHSLLALYHLTSGISPADLPGVDEVLNEAKEKLPKVVRRAVLVGSALSPANPLVKDDGTVVNTLWGEMAWQLLGAKGYAIVANADRASTSPGADLLRKLFKAAGPCMVLIDEWVVYVRLLYGKTGLPGGTFDDAFSFAQSLTEAVRTSSNALLVASIPSSDNEIGGDAGRMTLDRLKNVFGRMDSPWRPASAEEGFEIVRRRLFQPILDPAKSRARDAVVKAFSEMYRENTSEFPSECREGDYERRLQAAYPIHPELFDRLYNDWSTLDRFQRTRGVLRLLAKTIHSLWAREDRNLLILPATLPIDDPDVKYELTHYLDDNWVPIIDQDVDGATSVPYRLDGSNPNLGRYSAVRRVARTIYLGSAPTIGTANRGIDGRSVRLGCAQPGESVATFGDALHHLLDHATFLFQEGGRYWYDTHQNVTKTARDRAAQWSIDDVYEEIRRRVRRAQSQRGDFVKVHPFPSSSADVPDDMDARLVILDPKAPYDSKQESSPALAWVTEILEQRGNSPRVYRNTLVFLVCDSSRLADLERAVREYLAWDSIKRDPKGLNLDQSQLAQAQEGCERADRTLSQRIPEAYQWVILPEQKAGETKYELHAFRVQAEGSLAVRVSKRLKRDGILLAQLSSNNLRHHLDDVPLWRGDHVKIAELQEMFAKYIYLPRLRGSDLIISAVEQGIGMLSWQQDSFAYADSYDEEKKRYQGLVFGQRSSIAPTGLLVKPEVALRQYDEEKPKEQIKQGQEPSEGVRDQGTEKGSEKGKESTTPATATKALPRRFYARISLDPLRLGTQAGQVADEVLGHLKALAGANVEVSLEIRVDVPDGIPEQQQRTVNENCTTIGFDTYEFEEE